MTDANTSSTKPERKVIGKSLGLAIVISAALVCLFAVWVYINRPETDDATMRANFIGIAPHASGHIVDLLVKDNQFVHEGDLLFTIDPRPYEHAVARAKANLVLTRKEVDALIKALKVADAAIAKANAQVAASAAEIERAEAQSIAAETGVSQAEKALTAAKSAVAAAKAQRLAVEAGLEQSKVDRLRAEDNIGRE